jgi:cytidine deaminase
MQTFAFTELPEKDQKILRETVERLPRALNKVSNPRTSVIATTKNGKHFGNNIFLSNCTLFCAEANAIGAAVAAGDPNVEKIYLSIGRLDAKAPKIVSPCGNCRQILHDFSRLSGKAITVYSTTNKLEEVMVTDSDELLPDGFKSASLGKMADEATVILSQ